MLQPSNEYLGPAPHASPPGGAGTGIRLGRASTSKIQQSKTLHAFMNLIIIRTTRGFGVRASDSEFGFQGSLRFRAQGVESIGSAVHLCFWAAWLLTSKQAGLCQDQMTFPVTACSQNASIRLLNTQLSSAFCSSTHLCQYVARRQPNPPTSLEASSKARARAVLVWPAMFISAFVASAGAHHSRKPQTPKTRKPPKLRKPLEAPTKTQKAPKPRKRSPKAKNP